MVDLARLVAPWDETEIRPDVAGTPEALRIVDGCRKRECGELLALYVDETGAIALRAGAGDAAEIERLFAETEPRIGAPERDLQRQLTDSWSHRESRSHRN